MRQPRTKRSIIAEQIRSRIAAIREGQPVSAVAANPGTFFHSIRLATFYKGHLPNLDQEQLPAVFVAPDMTDFAAEPSSHSGEGSWLIGLLVCLAREQIDDYETSDSYFIEEEIFEDIARALTEDGPCPPVSREAGWDILSWEPAINQPNYAVWVMTLQVTYAQRFKQF